MGIRQALLTLIFARRDQQRRELAFLLCNRTVFVSGPDTCVKRAAADVQKAPMELGQLCEGRA